MKLHLCIIRSQAVCIKRWSLENLAALVLCMFLACGTALLTIEWVRTEVVAGDKVTPMPVVATCAGCNCKHTIQWCHSYKLHWIRVPDIHKNNANWFPYKNIHDTVVTCISKYNFLLDHWKAFTCYAAYLYRKSHVCAKHGANRKRCMRFVCRIAAAWAVGVARCIHQIAAPSSHQGILSGEFVYPLRMIPSTEYRTEKRLVDWWHR